MTDRELFEQRWHDFFATYAGGLCGLIYYRSLWVVCVCLYAVGEWLEKLGKK